MGHLHVIFGVLEHLWPVVPLVNGFVGEGLPFEWFLQSPSWISPSLPSLPLVRGILDKDRSVAWSDFLYRSSPMSIYLVVMCCSFCASAFSSRSIPSLK